jgi:hypothetical protein
VTPLLALLHVPKAGGSTLAALIKRNYGVTYGKSRSIDAILDPATAAVRLRAIGEAPEPSRQPALVGHFVFGMRDLLPPDTRYVTVLRDPVERTLSHFAYVTRPETRRAPVTLEQWLADRRGLPDNLQTRMIVAQRSPFEPLPAHALAQAKEHLVQRFAFVGVTERLDELVALLTAKLGWSARLPERRRVSEARLQRDDLPVRTLSEIERTNELDRELHAFAYDLFARALEDADEDVALELDVLRRAVERAGGDPSATPPSDDLRARLVEARAELVLREARVERLERRVARMKKKIRAARDAA